MGFYDMSILVRHPAIEMPEGVHLPEISRVQGFQHGIANVVEVPA